MGGNRHSKHVDLVGFRLHGQVHLLSQIPLLDVGLLWKLDLGAKRKHKVDKYGVGTTSGSAEVAGGGTRTSFLVLREDELV